MTAPAAEGAAFLALALASSLLLLLAAALRVRRGERPWGLRDAILALLVLVQVGTVVAGAPLPGQAPGATPGLGRAVLGTGLGGALACTYGLLRAWPDRRRLGLRAPAPWAWLAALLLVPAFLGVAIGWSLLLDALGQPSPPQRILDEILDDPTRPAALAALLYGALLAPLFEELVFRGLLLAPLAERYGAALAVLASSALFGLMHLSDPASVVPLTLFGVALGALRLRSGSLGPPLLLHAGNNSLAFTLALLGLG